MKRKEWRSGQDIVKQGDLGRFQEGCLHLTVPGKAFYLIMSGEAAVVTNADGGTETTRAVLRRGHEVLEKLRGPSKYPVSKR